MWARRPSVIKGRPRGTLAGVSVHPLPTCEVVRTWPSSGQGSPGNRGLPAELGSGKGSADLRRGQDGGLGGLNPGVLFQQVNGETVGGIRGKHSPLGEAQRRQSGSRVGVWAKLRGCGQADSSPDLIHLQSFLEVWDGGQAPRRLLFR